MEMVSPSSACKWTVAAFTRLTDVDVPPNADKEMISFFLCTKSNSMARSFVMKKRLRAFTKEDVTTDPPPTVFDWAMAVFSSVGIRMFSLL